MQYMAVGGSRASAMGWLSFLILMALLMSGCAKLAPSPPPPPPPPPPPLSPPPEPPPVVIYPPLTGGGAVRPTPAASVSVRPRRASVIRPVPAVEAAVGLSDQCRGLGIIDPAQCVDHDQMVSNLRDGVDAFKVDRRMVKDKEYVAALAITRATGDPAALTAALANVEGVQTTGRTKVARDMSARLTGIGFTVSPAGLVRMRLNATAPTTWEWKVVPTSSGRRELKLETFVHFALPGGEEVEALPIKRQLVEVSVAPPPPGVKAKEEMSFWTSVIDAASKLVTSVTGLIAAVVALAAALGWKLRKDKGAPANAG